MESSQESLLRILYSIKKSKNSILRHWFWVKISLFRSYNKYWLFAESVDFPHQSNTNSPENSKFSVKTPNFTMQNIRTGWGDVSENTNLRFLGHLFLSFRTSPWGGTFSLNAASRFCDSSSVRCRILMQHGSCSLAGGAWTRAAKQLPNGTVMTLPNGSTAFK